MDVQAEWSLSCLHMPLGTQGKQNCIFFLKTIYQKNYVIICFRPRKKIVDTSLRSQSPDSGVDSGFKTGSYVVSHNCLYFLISLLCDSEISILSIYRYNFTGNDTVICIFISFINKGQIVCKKY